MLYFLLMRRRFLQLARKNKRVEEFLGKSSFSNVMRLFVLSFLILLTGSATVILSCKVRDESIKPSAPNEVQAPPSKTSAESIQMSSDATALVEGQSPDHQLEPKPIVPGGPIAGIEVFQNGNPVSAILVGIPVQFKLTVWSRDTSAESGCPTNRGIVQASWTIGSRASVDLQRFAGQDCRSFDYTGTFTNAGQILVKLDILTNDDEALHIEQLYDVNVPTK